MHTAAAHVSVIGNIWIHLSIIFIWIHEVRVGGIVIYFSVRYGGFFTRDATMQWKRFSLFIFFLVCDKCVNNCSSTAKNNKL